MIQPHPHQKTLQMSQLGPERVRKAEVPGAPQGGGAQETTGAGATHSRGAGSGHARCGKGVEVMEVEEPCSWKMLGVLRSLSFSVMVNDMHTHIHTYIYIHKYVNVIMYIYIYYIYIYVY